jgi:hypothetical protein
MLHVADVCRVPAVGIFSRSFSPQRFGFQYSINHSLVGNTPPDDVSAESVLAAYRTIDVAQRTLPLRRESLA